MSKYQYSGSKGHQFAGDTTNEIKSHSSVLFNERVHMLFAMLDMNDIDLRTKPSIKDLQETAGILKQIWKNVRSLIYNNPYCRQTLGLETNVKGVYTPDLGFKSIQNKINNMVDRGGFTYTEIQDCIDELDYTETIIRDILQYYKYFIRPEYKQKPDINAASERFRNMYDDITVNKFLNTAGASRKFNLEDDDDLADESIFDEDEDDEE